MATLNTPLAESQNRTVLKALQQHAYITSAEAFSDFGIGRLAARVNDLKKRGVPIQKVMVRFTSRSGHPGRYAKYYLEKEETQTGSCDKSCGPSDFCEGGKCDKNGCYHKNENQ